MASWISSWFRSAEQLKDDAITGCTKFDITNGLWFCYLRSDISSHFIRRYLIHYMKGKYFQAISTGSHSVCFQQDISNRRCAALLSVVNNKKRIKFEYYEGDTLDPNSSTSVFFQSILLELASELADKNMLYGQKFIPLESIPSSLSSIADENTFMNPKEQFWVAFLRPESATVARKVIVRFCSNSRFSVDEGSDKLALYLTNKELYLTLKIIIGYNNKDELLVHAFYSSLPRPAITHDDLDSDDDDDDDDSDLPNQTKNEPSVQSVKTGDPDLRKGDREYFHSFLLGLGRQLAQHELLRTQAEEFHKSNALGKPRKASSPSVKDDTESTQNFQNGRDDQDEDDEDDEPLRDSRFPPSDQTTSPSAQQDQSHEQQESESSFVDSICCEIPLLDSNEEEENLPPSSPPPPESEPESSGYAESVSEPSSTELDSYSGSLMDDHSQSHLPTEKEEPPTHSNSPEESVVWWSDNDPSPSPSQSQTELESEPSQESEKIEDEPQPQIPDEIPVESEPSTQQPESNESESFVHEEEEEGSRLVESETELSQDSEQQPSEEESQSLIQNENENENEEESQSQEAVESPENINEEESYSQSSSPEEPVESESPSSEIHDEEQETQSQEPSVVTPDEEHSTVSVEESKSDELAQESEIGNSGDDTQTGVLDGVVEQSDGQPLEDSVEQSLPVEESGDDEL